MTSSEIAGAALGALILTALFMTPVLWVTRRKFFSKAIVEEYPNLFDASFEKYIQRKLGDQFNAALVQDVLKFEHTKFKNRSKKETYDASIKYDGGTRGGKMYLYAMQGDRREMSRKIAAEFPSINKKQALMFTQAEEAFVRRKKLQQLLRLSA